MQDKVANNFFTIIIEGYLFLDLRNMSQVEQMEGEEGGGLGYPMLSTIVAGIELLGGVLQTENTYNDGQANSKRYFDYYWKNYLAANNNIYDGYNDIVWRLVRNGVMHTYIAKAAITVTKGKKSAHLLAHSDGRLNIDCKEFYNDFLASYELLVKPKLRTNSGFLAAVANNIRIMQAESEDVSKDVLEEHLISSPLPVQTTISVTESMTSTTTIPYNYPQGTANLSATPLSASSGESTDRTNGDINGNNQKHPSRS